MTRLTITAIIIALSGCVEIWPHNETPHVYQQDASGWRDLGAVE